jgi:hypothetical protein
MAATRSDRNNWSLVASLNPGKPHSLPSRRRPIGTGFAALR